MKRNCLFLKVTREFILFVLLLVTVVCIFSEPADDCNNWFGVFIESKAIGFATGWVMYKLVMYWSNHKLLVDNMEESDDIA